MPRKLWPALLAILFSFGPGGHAQAADDGLLMYTIVPGADVRLQDDYGVMLINEGGEKDPTPRYILAIRKTRTLVDTRDLAVFRLGLATLAKGSTIYQYDSCTVPRSYGLTQAQHDAFYGAIKKAGLKLGEDKELDRLICYCKALEQAKWERVRAARQKKEAESRQKDESEER